MRGLPPALVIGCCACGRLAFDPASAPVDAGPDAMLGPFAAAVPVDLASVAGSDDQDPSLRDDLLEIYFRSDRPGSAGTDIWRATRAAITDPWGAPENVVELNTPRDEGTPELAPDGLAIYFNRNKLSDPTDYDVAVSTRTSFTDPWSAPVTFAAATIGGTDGGAVFDDGSGLTMVFHSTPTGNGSAFDLYITERADDEAAWGAPVPLAELNTNAIERNAHLRAGGRMLVYSSNATGNGDIYYAMRTTSSEPFEPRGLLEGADLATEIADSDPWLSADLRTLYFSTGRLGSSDRRIFFATR